MAAGTDVRWTVLIFLLSSTITGISGESKSTQGDEVDS